MKNPGIPNIAIASSTTLALAAEVLTADTGSVRELIDNLTSKDDKILGPAWQNAGKYGASVVQPLIELMNTQDFETVRAAKRALWQVVRHAGRPGAEGEAKAVVAQLLPLLSSGASQVRRELLWMLSEIAGNEAVDAMAKLLSDQETREDARCALQRIPGDQAVAALRKAFASATEDFKSALAESLIARGERVDGYRSKKLIPSKPTEVKAVAPK